MNKPKIIIKNIGEPTPWPSDIVPDKATVYESKDRVVIGNTHLKVMMEEDYLAFNKHLSSPKVKLTSFHKDDAKELNNLSSVESLYFIIIFLEST